ncbi:hypothetical protein [Planomicrobium sp. Y74]|uniref:hypothetical protein n=1 Tax=Planomicrobium sp. Y74 TaxID=2478977 RepID=UPI000EF4897A|nr:hypothetical protein [Planomicrobium sp. Y74]RLQ91954.1 hypothetical protein D9754_03985 [Planomicrobium sp. Y74]
MEKWDYIDAIITELKGTTDTNFQVKIGEVLKNYYKDKKLTYEMPNSSGGDDKNDGWVLEEQKFYQIYSPQQFKGSFRKDIQQKFSEDLEGLLSLIYNEGKWGGQLKQFIFIVNTIDRNLPHDSERFFDKEREKFEKQYKIKFKVKVVNLDFIRDILLEMSEDRLRNLSSLLRVTSMIDYNALTLTMLYDFIDVLNEGVQLKLRGKMTTSATDYNRISTPYKIALNDLEEVSDDIEFMIMNLHVLEEMIGSVYQDMEYTEKLQRIISYIINEYQVLSESKKGVELYKEIIRNIVSFTETNKSYMFPVELLVVYIFDKCDIFEKERVGV